MLVRILALCAALALPGSAMAGSKSLDQGADRFVVGGSVRVFDPVAGDLIAAGGKVDVNAAVNGDAVVGGGDVRIGGAVGQSLYTGGGNVTLDGAVARNVRVAGGRIELGPRAVVSGNLSAAGGRVHLEGTVKGYVQASGGRLLIDGAVDGDVVARSGAVELGPKARIGGKLRYASHRELKRDPAAQVTGGVEVMPMVGRPGEAPERRTVARTGRWLWTAGLVLTAIVLVAAMPAFTTRVATTLRTRAGTSLLAGLVALVCIPVAAAVLLITVIGIPLALIALLLYLALLLVGYTMTGIAVGDWVLARHAGANVAAMGRRVLAAALAVLVIALLGRVPWVGWLVSFAALIAGVGALVMQARRAPAQAVPAAP
ncbi:MAG TPA: polymer-forming cytoskeletal protein [Albitalea sp.]|uniref:polymer-forming cytoskeletal protein n=1 Tax=Piscinibacter sp. TaxID=1903157 RepID=UPI002ED24D98